MRILDCLGNELAVGQMVVLKWNNETFTAMIAALREGSVEHGAIIHGVKGRPDQHLPEKVMPTQVTFVLNLSIECDPRQDPIVVGQVWRAVQPVAPTAPEPETSALLPN